MLNVIILMGRLSKDPQIISSGDVTAVSFDLAVDNVRKESDGTRGSSFFQVKCFGNVADNVDKCLAKGSKVAIRGTIQQRNFIRKDGSKGSTYEVVADAIEFLDSKKLENEEHEDKVEEVCEPAAEEAKFDPYTGKPLSPENKPLKQQSKK